MSHHTNALRRWELALLLGVALAALCGVWLEGQQSALADKVIRLHVIANSDTPSDQALKRKVRDRILADAFPLLDGATAAEAAGTLAGALPQIAAAGADTVEAEGYAYPVSASLEETFFPTKSYPDFALPAGRYQALRVVIGDGAGQNWWCVVFPPLCLGAVTETVEETAYTGGLGEQDVALMTGESEGYVVKFRALELWGQFQKWVSGT